MRSTCLGAALIGLGLSLMASLVIGSPLFFALYCVVSFLLIMIVECASICPGRFDRRKPMWRWGRRSGRGIIIK